MTPYELSLLIYNAALIPVVFLSVFFFILALTVFFSPAPRKHKVASDFTPHVTVQIPSFNDPVAARCIEACLKLDYPKNRFDIMILDDSTDEKTRKLLKAYAKHPNVTYRHRTNRVGYKPGAMAEAMRFVRGEFIVVFDADFEPRPEFLKRITAPFKDKRVAIVQGQQAITNSSTNLISRFAAYQLMIHHSIIMPINDRLNSVLFCGTAGAIRKSAMESVGGWNIKSITEDTELSVRLISAGWKTAYVALPTPSEVPDTLESYVKQQMRWCYGNFRVFMDNWRSILGRSKLTLGQRVMVTYFTTGNIIAPAVLVMTLAGMSGWFLGEPQIMQFIDLLTFASKFLFTAGFVTLGAVMLRKHRRLSEFPHLVGATLTVSIVLCVANTVAMFRAVFLPHKPLFPTAHNSWICTPKSGNASYTA